MIQRSLRLWLGCFLLSGCSQPAPPVDPVRDSFHNFVAYSEARARGEESGAYRIRFDSGRGFTPATGDTPAEGTVSVRIESPTEVRQGLGARPAMAIYDHDLTFIHRNGNWEFKTGTCRTKLLEAFISSGRTASKIEPEKTETMTALGTALERLFYAK